MITFASIMKLYLLLLSVTAQSGSPSDLGYSSGAMDQSSASATNNLCRLLDWANMSGDSLSPHNRETLGKLKIFYLSEIKKCMADLAGRSGDSEPPGAVCTDPLNNPEAGMSSRCAGGPRSASAPSTGILVQTSSDDEAAVTPNPKKGCEDDMESQKPVTPPEDMAPPATDVPLANSPTASASSLPKDVMRIVHEITTRSYVQPTSISAFTTTVTQPVAVPIVKTVIKPPLIRTIARPVVRVVTRNIIRKVPVFINNPPPTPQLSRPLMNMRPKRIIFRQRVQKMPPNMRQLPHMRLPQPFNMRSPQQFTMRSPQQFSMRPQYVPQMPLDCRNPSVLYHPSCVRPNRMLDNPPPPPNPDQSSMSALAMYFNHNGELCRGHGPGSLCDQIGENFSRLIGHPVPQHPPKKIAIRCRSTISEDSSYKTPDLPQENASTKDCPAVEEPSKERKAEANPVTKVVDRVVEKTVTMTVSAVPSGDKKGSPAPTAVPAVVEGKKIATSAEDTKRTSIPEGTKNELEAMANKFVREILRKRLAGHVHAIRNTKILVPRMDPSFQGQRPYTSPRVESIPVGSTENNEASTTKEVPVDQKQPAKSQKPPAQDQKKAAKSQKKAAKSQKKKPAKKTKPAKNKKVANATPSVQELVEKEDGIRPNENGTALAGSDSTTNNLTANTKGEKYDSWTESILDRLEKSLETEGSLDMNLLEKAIDALKQDPSEAADPPLPNKGLLSGMPDTLVGGSIKSNLVGDEPDESIHLQSNGPEPAKVLTLAPRRGKRAEKYKDKLLKELMTFITKKQRSDEDIVKVLELVRMAREYSRASESASASVSTSTGVSTVAVVPGRHHPPYEARGTPHTRSKGTVPRSSKTPKNEKYKKKVKGHPSIDKGKSSTSAAPPATLKSKGSVVKRPATATSTKLSSKKKETKKATGDGKHKSNGKQVKHKEKKASTSTRDVKPPRRTSTSAFTSRTAVMSKPQDSSRTANSQEAGAEDNSNAVNSTSEEVGVDTIGGEDLPGSVEGDSIPCDPRLAVCTAGEVSKYDDYPRDRCSSDEVEYDEPSPDVAFKTNSTTVTSRKLKPRGSKPSPDVAFKTNSTSLKPRVSKLRTVPKDYHKQAPPRTVTVFKDVVSTIYRNAPPPQKQGINQPPAQVEPPAPTTNAPVGVPVGSNAPSSTVAAPNAPAGVPQPPPVALNVPVQPQTKDVVAPPQPVAPCKDPGANKTPVQPPPTYEVYVPVTQDGTVPGIPNMTPCGGPGTNPVNNQTSGCKWVPSMVDQTAFPQPNIDVQQPGDKKTQRKKKLKSAELTVETLDGNNQKLISMDLPIDQLTNILKSIPED